jgi:hypothetical protein
MRLRLPATYSSARRSDVKQREHRHRKQRRRAQKVLHHRFMGSSARGASQSISCSPRRTAAAS